jgi:ATP-dependent Clp protease ATP-binding subunit ClpB
MDLSKLTTRAQQALVAARDQATARNHGGIHPAHLLRALVAQTEGLVLPLLQAIDVAPNDVRQAAEVELNKLPQVYGGSEPQMTQDLARVLEIADQRRSDFKDDYISVEHL